MSINRKIQPALSEVDKINFVSPIQYQVSDNVPLFHMKEVANDTAKIDLYFDAGKIKGPNGESSFVNGLLLSGTLDKTSTEINRQISSLGGFFESGIAMESAALSIYCLRENISEIVTIVLDAIANVTFPEDELIEYKNDRKQRHNINMGKVSFLAQREFQMRMFSSDKDYSKVTDLEDIEVIQREQLIDFHKQHYLLGLTKAFIVGNIEEQEVNSIINQLKSFAIPEHTSFKNEMNNASGEFHVIKENALQSAIRIGKILFNKTHEDYLDFLILNTIIGDYFGSRLMTNIREDKGYTYGIGSSVVEFSKFGYFIIATEVGSDHREAAINEIKMEIERLQEELVTPIELELVKNYMLGQLLKSADGPYAMSDLFLSAMIQGKDLSFYNEAIQSIHDITPLRIRDLARKHLNWESFTVVSAG